MAFFKDKEIPEELVKEALNVLQRVRTSSGRLRKGTNEVTKTIERTKSKLVLIAEDVAPPEIVAHLPLLCKEKKVQYVFIPTKEELGKAAGLDVGSASISVIDGGEASISLDKLVDKLAEL